LKQIAKKIYFPIYFHYLGKTIEYPALVSETQELTEKKDIIPLFQKYFPGQSSLLYEFLNTLKETDSAASLVKILF